jgi:hypothetical protein
MGEPSHDESQATDAPRAEPFADRPLSSPDPERLSPEDPAYRQILRAHDEALHAGADAYVDPSSGLMVLTAGYLARRGSCCGAGCRHCPYVT